MTAAELARFLGNMIIATIRFRRGNEADIPILRDGEPAWCRDSHKLFIGTPTAGNVQIVGPTGATGAGPTGPTGPTGAGGSDLTGPISSLAGVTSITQQTGTGTVFAMQASPSFTTQISTPKILGGTNTSSSVTYQTTTAIGTTGADHVFVVGTNGGTEGMRIKNDGTVNATSFIGALTGNATTATTAANLTGPATIATSVTTPKIIGGTSTTSTLILQTTTGVGTTGADIVFIGGNNGATEFARFLNSGSLGVGTSPNASALLDVASTTKGFLPPRMTTTQRDAISSPVEGLVIHNTTTHKLNVHDNSAWTEVGGGTATLVTVANEASGSTCFLGFFTAATGDLGAKTNSNLAFDSSTGIVTFGSSIKFTGGYGAVSSTNDLRIGAGGSGVHAASICIGSLNNGFQLEVGTNNSGTFLAHQIFYDSGALESRIFIAGDPTGLTIVGPGAGKLAIVGGSGSPVSGKIYVGDGSGWHLYFAKRTGSVDTTLIDFADSGKVTFFAPGTAAATLNLPVSAAPTSPVDGDVWREDNTNTGLKIRINGVTKTVTVS